MKPDDPVVPTFLYAWSTDASFCFWPKRRDAWDRPIVEKPAPVVHVCACGRKARPKRKRCTWCARQGRSLRRAA